jgi:hypothetical protein
LTVSFSRFSAHHQLCDKRIPNMDIYENLTQHLPPAAVKAIVIVLGVLAIYLALKIAHFFFKTLFILIGIALLVLAAKWLLSK